MEKIDFTLIGDGNSDKCLLPILAWAVRQTFPDIPVNGEWADFRHLTFPPKSLTGRIRLAIELYNQDAIFIHRDAEGQEPQFRYDEIQTAMTALTRVGKYFSLPYICVVPVRMTEAWLLFDESAIRKASGNPNGQDRLNLPPLRNLEILPDPKEVLSEALTLASGLRGRQLRKFNPARHRHLIAENIEDFSPLTDLSAIQRLLQDIARFENNRGQR